MGYFSAIALLARTDLKLALKERSTILWLFIMPAIFFYFIGTVTQGGVGFTDSTVELLVDNRASQTGASTTILKPSQEVVWVLDPNFNKPRPFVLDMNVVRASNGVLAVRVVRTDGAKIPPAKGARR